MLKDVHPTAVVEGGARAAYELDRIRAAPINPGLTVPWERASAESGQA